MLYRSPQLYVAADGSLTVDPAGGDLPPSLGSLIIEWMHANLVHGEGDLEGEPFEVPDHFVEPLFRLYEYHPVSGRRLVQRALWGTPKGSAKTEIAGAVIAAELAGPVVVEDGLAVLRRAPKIVAGAASERQADEVYAEAFAKMVAPLADEIDGPYDKATMLVGRSGMVQRVASKASTNDGKKPTVVVADEFHEWVDAKARNHLVLTNGLAKRRDALELNITTAGAAQHDSPCQRLYRYGRRVAAGEVVDPRFLFWWWEGPDNVDYSDADSLRAALEEANPAEWVDLDRLQRRAHEIPEYEHRRYFLNQWTTTDVHWITAEAWGQCSAPDREWSHLPVILFFDGSYSSDSSALVAVTIDEVPHVAVLGTWENPAFLMDQPEVDGWRVDRPAVHTAVEAAMADLDVREFWVDPWGWHDELRRWQDQWPEMVHEHHTGQVRKVVAPACSLMWTSVSERRVTHDADPTLARHVANAVTRDTPDGRYIVKDGPMSPRKIDAAYAATLGLWYAAEYVEAVEELASPSAVFV